MSLQRYWASLKFPSVGTTATLNLRKLSSSSSVNEIAVKKVTEDGVVSFVEGSKVPEKVAKGSDGYSQVKFLEKHELPPPRQKVRPKITLRQFFLIVRHNVNSEIPPHMRPTKWMWATYLFAIGTVVFGIYHIIPEGWQHTRAFRSEQYGSSKYGNPTHFIDPTTRHSGLLSGHEKKQVFR